ncbi:MAG: class I SAM-dependent methyltransferase [Spirochaetales bacterium]|nr:class I SAM-dependent methyltransferase [Spirochaetales bacterium]
MKNDFRIRCYESFFSTKWKYTHSEQQKIYSFYAKITKNHIKNILPESRTSHIIDLACGSGHFLYFLQQEGYTNYQGIDISDEMLDQCKAFGIKGCFKADVYSFLPDHQQEYDFIIANDFIEHLTKDEALKLLDLIHAALLPGGKILISTLNAMSLFGFGRLQNEFTHITGYTPQSLAQILRVCKFRDIRLFGEKPVVHDIKSAFRKILWKLMTLILRVFLTIESGTGRGMWKQNMIFEPRFFACAGKSEKNGNTINDE